MKNIIKLEVWGKDKDRGIHIDIGNKDNISLEHSEYHEDGRTCSITAEELYKILSMQQIQFTIAELNQLKKDLLKDTKALQTNKKQLMKDIRDLSSAITLVKDVK